MTIVVVGLNHKTAPVELREQFSFADGLLPTALAELQLGTLQHQEDGSPGSAQAMKLHHAREIVCINRTYTHAAALMARIEGRVMDWSHLREALTWADIVIGATSAPHAVIYAPDVSQILPQRDDRPLIFIDIAVPRNIEESVGNLPGVHYFGIDDLETAVDGNLAQRQAAVPQVQAIVSTETANVVEWLHCRQVTPVIAALHRKAEALAEAEVVNALQHLTGLSTREQEVIIRLGQRIVHKLLHEPTVQLKAQAVTGNGYSYAHVIREIFMLNESGSSCDGEAYPEPSVLCDLQFNTPRETA